MKQIIFHRQGKNIMAKIISINIEPLDNADSRQVVFFCQDSDGRRYRVPKSEAHSMCAIERKARKAK